MIHLACDADNASPTETRAASGGDSSPPLPMTSTGVHGHRPERTHPRRCGRTCHPGRALRSCDVGARDEAFAAPEHRSRLTRHTSTPTSPVARRRQWLLNHALRLSERRPPLAPKRWSDGHLQVPPSALNGCTVRHAPCSRGNRARATGPRGIAHLRQHYALSCPQLSRNLIG